MVTFVAFAAYLAFALFMASGVDIVFLLIFVLLVIMLLIVYHGVLNLSIVANYVVKLVEVIVVVDLQILAGAVVEFLKRCTVGVVRREDVADVASSVEVDAVRVAGVLPSVYPAFGDCCSVCAV